MKTGPSAACRYNQGLTASQTAQKPCKYLIIADNTRPMLPIAQGLNARVGWKLPPSLADALNMQEAVSHLLPYGAVLPAPDCDELGPPEV